MSILVAFNRLLVLLQNKFDFVAEIKFDFVI